MNRLILILLVALSSFAKAQGTNVCITCEEYPGSSMAPLAHKEIQSVLDVAQKAKTSLSLPVPVGPAPVGGISVAQGEMKFARRGETKTLHTQGLATCVGLALVHKKLGLAALVHADPMTDLDSTIRQATDFFKTNGANISDVEAVLVGGWKGWEASEETASTLIDLLVAHRIPIVGSDIVSPYAPPMDLSSHSGSTLPKDPNLVIKNVKIDLETGKISRFLIPQK